VHSDNDRCLLDRRADDFDLVIERETPATRL
jgi:hypothetical protein